MAIWNDNGINGRGKNKERRDKTGDSSSHRNTQEG